MVYRDARGVARSLSNSLRKQCSFLLVCTNSCASSEGKAVALFFSGGQRNSVRIKVPYEIQQKNEASISLLGMEFQMRFEP